MSIADKLNNIRNEVESMYLEREQPIRGIVLGLLSCQHIFLAGKPGTSKSALANEIKNRIVGADIFSVLLDAFTPPEVIFGAVSIQALQQDRYERAIDGYAPTAHIFFADEIWKTSGALANSMLELLNERTFKNGSKELKCPLISMIACSNETPQEDNMTAIYDRLMLRYLINYVSNSNVSKLLSLSRGQNQKRTTIMLDELKQAQMEVLMVKMEDPIIEEVAHLKAEIEQKGFIVSDRRWVHSMRLLQACAYLEGRDKVESNDLLVYADVLWDEMKDASRCASEIGKIVNPGLQNILERVDAVDKLLEGLVSSQTEEGRINALSKIKTHREELNKLKGVGGVKGNEAVARIGSKVNEAMSKLVKF